MITSCGVLLFSPRAELLLCHATGAKHWDIPKGVGEPGEAPLDTAVRETLEETGLQLRPEQLLDLGTMPYRPGKSLHLFAALSERVDPGQLHCKSLFRDRRGRMVTEVDRFEWTALDRVPQRCAMNMTEVLTERLSLQALHERLGIPTTDP